MNARRLTGSLLVLTALSAASPAFAQGAPADTAPKKADSTDPVERARVYYERGLQLFNEENYDAALFEFERAYELAPSYKILYNMGRIQRQQNNYAAALRSYERYLREGGANIPPERRAEVEKEQAILRPRVAEVVVHVNVDDADVYADDIPVCTATIESTCVGRSPLKAPLLVNGGRHKITASKKGYVTATSLVSVVGSDKIEVKLELVSLERKDTAVKQNPYWLPTYVGVGVTAAALIGAGVTGILSNSKQSDLDESLDTFPASRQDLDDKRDATRTLATTADILLIGSVVSAGVTSYFLVKALKWKRPTTTEISLGPVMGLTGKF